MPMAFTLYRKRLMSTTKDALSPQNVCELKVFLGLLSYCSKFLPYILTVLAPLYKLLQKSVNGFGLRKRGKLSKRLKTYFAY